MMPYIIYLYHNVVLSYIDSLLRAPSSNLQKHLSLQTFIAGSVQVKKNNITHIISKCTHACV